MSKTAPVVLVTGAARRIGAAIARQLHARGCKVALHYRESEADAFALRDALNAARPGSAVALQAELGDGQSAMALAEATSRAFGRIDGLVNNASSFFATPVGATTQDDWDALFGPNARAPFFLAQALAPQLRASGGAIVNLVDVYAERPLRQHTVYAMAKAALAAMTRSLALELAPEVRVNAVAPGAILWPEHPAHDGEAERQQAILARTPLARLGRPEDVAEAVCWLLLGARFTTGEVLRVDGGRMLAP